MPTASRILAGLLVACSLAIAQPAAADEADQLFDAGVASFEAGKTEDALKSFQAAWKLRKSYDLAAAMAQAELLLGKDRDAAEHLAYALRNFAVTAKPEKRARLEAAMAEVRAKVVTLHIRSNVDGADVRVNGASIGRTPLEPDVFAEPGTVLIEARADGYEDLRLSFDGKKGEERGVTLALTARTRSLLPAFVLGGVAVAAAGVGAGLAAVSTSKGAEAIQLRDAYVAAHGSKPCSAVPDSSTECGAIGDRLRAQDAFGNAAIGVFIGAGVAAAGAAGYAIFARRPPSATGVRAWPSVGTNGGGLVLTGSF
jgi:hypothetical protein